MNKRKSTIDTDQSNDVYTVNAKLCRLVSENPCLYDSRNANFKSVTNKTNVWVYIGKKLNMNVHTCQQRWRNMRHCYARSIRNNINSPTYYMHQELEFLRKYLAPGVPVPLKEEQDETDEDKPEIRDADTSSDEDNPEIRDADTSSDEDSENDMAGRQSRSPKRRKRNQDQFSNRNGERDMNFNEAFLQSLRPEIERMSFMQMLEFKRCVYDLLTHIFRSKTEVVKELSTPIRDLRMRASSTPYHRGPKGQPNS